MTADVIDIKTRRRRQPRKHKQAFVPASRPTSPMSRAAAERWVRDIFDGRILLNPKAKAAIDVLRRPPGKIRPDDDEPPAA